VKGFGKESVSHGRGLSSSSKKKIELALAIHAKGNIKQAIIQYKNLIKSGIEDERIYSALGFISLKNSQKKSFHF